MEIRAPYVIVGLVTIGAAAILVVVTLWLADPSFGEPQQRYNLFFEDMPAGLDVDSPVRFNGVRVGRVVETRIDEEEPTRIQVTIEVSAETPIREGAHAVILPQGITGTSYLQIRSGRDPGPPITADRDERLPVIPSRPSPMQRLVGGAPDFVTQSTLLVERVSRMVDEKNRVALTRSLQRIEKITGDLSEQTDDLDAARAEIERIGSATRDAARSIDAAARGLLDWIEDDLSPLTDETREAVRELDRSLNDRLIPGLTATTRDLGAVVDRAASIAERLESSPARFLLGDESVREVQLP
ncbi:MAG: MlaD family protein [bacterium]